MRTTTEPEIVISNTFEMLIQNITSGPHKKLQLPVAKVNLLYSLSTNSTCAKPNFW